MKALLLEGLKIDSLAHKLTRSQLQHRGSSLKSARHIWEEYKLINFRVRGGGVGVGATLSGVASASRHHCSFVESFLHPASRHIRHQI